MNVWNPCIFQSLKISSLFCLSLIIPLRRRTGEARGTSGGLGERAGDRKIGKEGEDEEGRRFSSGCGCYCVPLSSLKRRQGRTPAGFLSNAAETFRKSLQRQGRQALFLSPNWFSCSGCASDFLAARPSPSQRPLPASGRFGDLSSFSAPPPPPLSAPLLSLPARGRSAGLRAGRALPDADSGGSRSCRRLWQPSEARAGQRRATRAPPASNCSPSSFPLPSGTEFHKEISSVEMLLAWTFAQCAPSEEGLGLQTLLLGGKDISTPAFSASPPPQVDGLQTEAFGEGDLPAGLGEISLFADAKARGRMCCLRLSLSFLSLKCWELFQHQIVAFTSPFPVPSE